MVDHKDQVVHLCIWYTPIQILVHQNVKVMSVEMDDYYLIVKFFAYVIDESYLSFLEIEEL